MTPRQALIGMFVIAGSTACWQMGPILSDTGTDVEDDTATDEDSEVEDYPFWIIPDTNQNRCAWFEFSSSSWSWVDCDEIAPGTALYGQDGHYRPAARQHSYAIVGDGTVFDEVTGLTWERCMVGFEGEDCTFGAPLLGPWPGGVHYCSGLDLGGHDDWRLPSVHELAWLVDIDAYPPNIDPLAFPSTPISDIGLWSSTGYDCGWCESDCYLTFLYSGSSNGTFIGVSQAWSNNYGRCVRGAPPVLGDLELSFVGGDRLIEDLFTGLTWQGCVAGLQGAACEEGTVQNLGWRSALEHCEGLVWAGMDDWRLPDQNELASILNHEACNPAVFPEFAASGLAGGADHSTWTSTTNEGMPNFAAAVHFSFGTTASVNKSSPGRVICVCGGP